MRCALLLLLGLSLGMNLTATVQGADPLSEAEVVQRTKSSVAWFKGSAPIDSGTAVCFHPSGYFVTTSNLAIRMTANATRTVTLDLGQKTERTLPVKLVEVNASHKLAIWKAEAKIPFAFLPLGETSELVELTPLVTVCYSQAATAPTVNLVRITSLRRQAGKLHAIQVDSQLSVYHSGAPLVDPQGKLVGLVSGGILGAQVNLALPIERLGEILQTPQVTLTPIAGSSTKALEVRAEFLAPLADSAQLQMTLIVKTKEGPVKTLPLTSAQGVFTATFTPELDLQMPLKVRLLYPTGEIAATAADRPLAFGDQQIPLRQIRQVLTPGEFRVEAEGGKSIVAPLKEQLLELQLADRTIAVDLALFTALHVEPLPLRSYEYEVIASVGDRELGRAVVRSGSFAENILLVVGDRILEFTLEGTPVTTLGIPTDDGDRSARDLCVNEEGKVFVYNGTFKPRLSAFSQRIWTHRAVEGWSTVNNTNFGGIGCWKHYVFATDMLTANDGGKHGIVRIDTRTMSSEVDRFGAEGYTDLAVGHDGLLYAVSRSSELNVFDPATLVRQRILKVSGLRAVAANARGDIFAVTTEGILKLDPTGKTQKQVKWPAPDVRDIDLSPSGRLLVTAGSGVFLSDESLANFTRIDVPGGQTFGTFGSLNVAKQLSQQQ